MIPVKLTTTNGETKTMRFESKENVENFITAFSIALPVGYAVSVDAPLIGIHNGWLFGKRQDTE
jgi:hypothetical protein